jgi:hypothetical protein
MALQDLTPQLRTRLSRMERAVGWFVLLATALLLFGFGYYIYKTAERKGWFIQKVAYQTCLANATGLKEGDPVILMGFSVGEITQIEANGPLDYYGVTVSFQVKKPYYGYIWSDSVVKVASAGFLGSRTLELTKGVEGIPTVQENADKIATAVFNRKHYQQELKRLAAEYKDEAKALQELNDTLQADPASFYVDVRTAGSYYIDPAESPAVTERLERVVDQVEKALPNFLRLTNDLARILSNTATATSNFAVIAENSVPTSTQLAELSAQLRGAGALGEWALPPGSPAQLAGALTNANSLLTNANSLLVNTDTSMNLLVRELSRSLDNLANITSNLNSQVQVNSNLVKEVSDIIVHSDELVQGLKRHWLLRSAFKTPSTNAPAVEREGVLRAPNDPFRN